MRKILRYYANMIKNGMVFQDFTFVCGHTQPFPVDYRTESRCVAEACCCVCDDCFQKALEKDPYSFLQGSRFLTQGAGNTTLTRFTSQTYLAGIMEGVLQDNDRLLRWIALSKEGQHEGYWLDHIASALFIRKYPDELEAVFLESADGSRHGNMMESAILERTREYFELHRPSRGLELMMSTELYKKHFTWLRRKMDLLAHPEMLPLLIHQGSSDDDDDDGNDFAEKREHEFAISVLDGTYLTRLEEAYNFSQLVESSEHVK